MIAINVIDVEDYRVKISTKDFDLLSEQIELVSPLAPYERVLLGNYDEFYSRFEKGSQTGKPYFYGFPEGLVFFYSLMTLFNDIDRGGLIKYYYYRGLIMPFMLIKNYDLIQARDVEQALNKVTDQMLAVYKILKKKYLTWGWEQYYPLCPVDQLKETEAFVLERKPAMSIHMIKYIHAHPHEFCILTD